MKNGKIWMVIVSVLAAFLLSQGVMAAEPKNASNVKPYYKKVSGEVVSLSQTACIKTKSGRSPWRHENTDMVASQNRRPCNRELSRRQERTDGAHFAGRCRQVGAGSGKPQK
jgi:uncharacterized iron-regulated membrane protein